MSVIYLLNEIKSSPFLFPNNFFGLISSTEFNKMVLKRPTLGFSPVFFNLLLSFASEKIVFPTKLMLLIFTFCFLFTLINRRILFDKIVSVSCFIDIEAFVKPLLSKYFFIIFFVFLRTASVTILPLIKLIFSFNVVVFDFPKPSILNLLSLALSDSFIIKSTLFPSIFVAYI